jgi:hypothetical protein
MLVSYIGILEETLKKSLEEQKRCYWKDGLTNWMVAKDMLLNQELQILENQISNEPVIH